VLPVSHAPIIFCAVKLVNDPLVGDVMVGANGAKVSNVTEIFAGKEIFPAKSVWVAEIDLDPLAAVKFTFLVKAPAEHAVDTGDGVKSPNKSTGKLFVHVPEIVVATTFVDDPFVGDEITGATGATVSKFIVILVGEEILPAPSVCVAVIDLAPSPVVKVTDLE
jgi:hypothetical protein